MRSAPARWYFADTPALAEAFGPGSLAGNERLAVGPLRVGSSPTSTGLAVRPDAVSAPRFAGRGSERPP